MGSFPGEKWAGNERLFLQETGERDTINQIIRRRYADAEGEENMGKKTAAPIRTTGKTIPESRWLARITGLYLGASAIYILLGFCLREGPIVIIDEGLFTNIARSLAWEGKIAFRGQPVMYPYILYPLTLVPIYRLQALLGGDLYRWVQVFNVLLICSSVYPVFLFARDFSGDRRLALLAAGVTALIPDMMMGLFEMSEALIWPLALWSILFFWRMFSLPEKKTWAVLAGLFAGLLYSAKPGAVAMAGGILAVGLIVALRSRERILLRRVLTAAAVLLGMIVLVYVLYAGVFGYSFSLLGLYNKQTSDWAPSHAALAAGASLMQILMFVFACGGVFAVLPYFRLGKYTDAQKEMLLAATLGLIAVEIGTAVFVVPYAWDGTMSDIQLHLRYSAMYIPVWFVFCTPLWPDGAPVPAGKKEQPRKDTGLLIALAAVALFSIVPGLRIGFPKGGSSTINALSLSAFVTTNRLNGRVSGLILTVLFVLFLAFVCMTISSPAKRRMDFFTGVFAVLLLFNWICACVNICVPLNPAVAADARELNELLVNTPGEKLGVCPRNYDDVYIYWQEARLSRPMQQVTIDQAYIETAKANGVYRPYVPLDQAPNQGNGSTPEADYLVLCQSIAAHLELSDFVTATDTTNGIYTLVKLAPGQRWVDTMLYGMSEDVLRQGVVGELLCFDGRTGEWSLELQVEGAQGTKLTVGSDIGSQTDILSGGKETIRVPVSGNMIRISSDKDIYLYSYTTTTG